VDFFWVCGIFFCCGGLQRKGGFAGVFEEGCGKIACLDVVSGGENVVRCMVDVEF
jgi:hypothetical protein